MNVSERSGTSISCRCLDLFIARKVHPLGSPHSAPQSPTTFEIDIAYCKRHSVLSLIAISAPLIDQLYVDEISGYPSPAVDIRRQLAQRTHFRPLDSPRPRFPIRCCASAHRELLILPNSRRSASRIRRLSILPLCSSRSLSVASISTPLDCLHAIAHPSYYPWYPSCLTALGPQPISSALVASPAPL